MNLTPELVAEYKKILESPKEYNLHFNSLDEIFEKSETPISKHVVFEKYISIIKNRQLPKVIFYIIMDGMFEIKKDGNDFGYCVKFKIILP